MNHAEQGLRRGEQGTSIVCEQHCAGWRLPSLGRLRRPK